MHGGTLLKLPDQVVFACASRYAGRYVVTLSVDQVLFRQAIHVGELVTFLASVNHTGRSSMEVGVRVLAEDIPTRNQRHVSSCYFTMVAVEDGKSVAIPALAPVTDMQARRYREAQARKSARLELSKQFAGASN